MMSTKTVRNCPYCRTAISNKHLDEGITLTKKLLLKYFFAVNQAYKDLQRTRQNEIIQSQEKIIASLRATKTEYEKEMSLLRKDNEALHGKINRILDNHDEMKEKCEFYKESLTRDRMMNQHAHLLLEHCYHSMEDMKKKHLMQIATQQHDTDILLRQIHQEKKQVKTLHNQILTYQDSLIAKATSHRGDVELKDVQISVLHGDLMNKFGDIQQGFIPPKLLDMLETHMKVELSKEIMETARNSYKRGIVNIASLKLAQNKLLSKSCVRDEIHSAIVKHLTSCNDSDGCHNLINETRNHISAIKSEHENLSNLAFLNKLDRCDNKDAVINVKIPQAYLPNQIIQDDPNVMNFIQDSVKQKEKLLLKMAKTFAVDADAAAAVQKDEWLCAETPSKKRKPNQPTTSAPSPPPLPPPPPPPSPLPSPTLVKDKDKEELHIPIGAIVDIAKEFNSKKKKVITMVQGSKKPSADIKLNKMVCLNYNTKFFDSDVHMCDQESENVDIVNDFKNKLSPLEHRCTFVMKSGSYCFSKLHSHAQHAMYWDMTSFDVQRAYDVGAITNNELTQINKLHEEKDRFHHEIVSKDLGFCNVSKVVNMDNYYFERKKCNGTVDHGRFHFAYCNSPVWNVIDSISDDETVYDDE